MIICRCVPSSRSDHLPDCAAVILLVVVFSSGCYLNSLGGDFVHDDLVAVAGNPDVTGSGPVWNLLKNDFWGKPMADPASHKSYRPLTVLTFRLNWLLSGSVQSFHMTNVALHCTCAVLLLYFCRDLLAWRRDAALIAALMFAAHPVHTEAVASIVGRADVLCCVFYLSALIASSKSSLAWQGCSLVCAGLALLSKEQGVTVLGVCLTLQLLMLTEKNQFGEKGTEANYKFKQKRIQVSEDVSPLQLQARIVILLSMMSGLVYVRNRMLYGSYPQFGEQDNPAAFAKSWMTRFLTYMYLPAFNLWLLLCPDNLSYDWQMGSIPLVESPWELKNAATLAYVLALVTIVLKASDLQGMDRRQVVLSLSLMLFSFLPATNLLVTVGFVVAERVLYIPSLGFCLLVSHGLQRLMQRGALLAWLCRAGALLLILFFVLKTMARNNAWASRESLFTSGLQSVPNNAKVHYNYANYKKDIGDKEAAIHHYRIALRLWPNHASSHNNLGTLVEDSDEAERHFRQAIAINPCHAKAYYNLASIYNKKGQIDVSEKLLLRAIQLDPEFVSAISALASLYGEFEEEKKAEAERLHLLAVTLNPENADALNNYGTFLEKSGRKDEAMSQYEKAMAVQPNHTIAILNAARSLRSLDHSRKAEELYKRALDIEEDPQIMDNLGALYFVSGRNQEAKKIYKHLLLHYPDRNETKLQYAQILIQERSFQQAEFFLTSILDAPCRREGLFHLAILYNFTNRTSEALDTILKALNLCSASESVCAKYHEEHGNILKDTRDLEAAEESYRLALMLDSKLPRAHLNLAVIYHIQGNYPSAKHHYQEAYKLDSSPPVLLDNMRKLQERRFGLSQNTCWRTDSACILQ